MNSVHSFGLFPSAPQFLPQRISGSGYEIDRSSEVFKPFNVCSVNYDEGISESNFYCHMAKIRSY